MNSGHVFTAILCLFSVTTAGCQQSATSPVDKKAKAEESAPAADNAEKLSKNKTETSATLPAFVDVSQELGFNFTYERGESGKFWPVEPTGGGAAWLDFDSDGYLDLLCVNGAQLPVDPKQTFLGTRIFQNHQAWHFADVTQSAGILSHDYGQGIVAGDYDNDGDPDFVVTNLGRCGFYENNGDGTFHEITDRTATVGGEWNTGGCLADLNRDGNLDLYIADYFHFDQTNYVSCRRSDGTPQYCGPSDSPHLPDHLYLSRGDGHFQDVSEVLGYPTKAAPGFGAVATDVDDDGWPDLYVANDAAPNYLWHNQTGQIAADVLVFEEKGFLSGLAVNADGLHQASMGLACGDVDGNGTRDLAISHFIFEYSTLYQNSGPLDFLDVTAQWGMAGQTMPTMGWGIGFLDFDNDGWLDLLIVNGHLNRTGRASEPYEMTPHLFHNTKGRRFVDVAGSAPNGYLREAVVARGIALGDWDNDGRQDLAVIHHHQPSAIVRNETASTFRSVTIELVGKICNRDAINAKVQLVVATSEDEKSQRTLTHEIVSGDGYLSSNSRLVHFGLGNAEKIVSGTIFWPSGSSDTFDHWEGSRFLITQGCDSLAPQLVRLP